MVIARLPDNSVLNRSFSVDRTYVILIAQVFNGCLLPLFSSCLLLCLNDKQFMAGKPQSGKLTTPPVRRLFEV